MPEPLTAGDLMLTDVAHIEADRTLGEALDALLALQEHQGRPAALAVVTADGGFDGLVTAPLLLRSLLTLWQPHKSLREDPTALQRELLNVVSDRSTCRVHDTLVRGLPTVTRGARLLELIDAGCEHRLAYIPVVEAGRLLGLVPISAVFQATAGVALTPELMGFRTDRDAAGDEST